MTAHNNLQILQPQEVAMDRNELVWTSKVFQDMLNSCDAGALPGASAVHCQPVIQAGKLVSLHASEYGVR